MKWTPIALVAVSACACLAMPAQSRAAASASDLSLKLGAFFPGSSDSRDLGGATQYVIGLDYLLPSASTKTSATSVYLDYLGGAKNSGSVHTTGVGLSLRSTGSNAYFGAGLGIYSTNVTFDNDGDDIFRGNSSTSSTGGGGKVFAGFDLGSGVDLEFDYHILPSAGGVSPSGAAIEVGIRL
jgi:hypothetical protein